MTEAPDAVEGNQQVMGRATWATFPVSSPSLDKLIPALSSAQGKIKPAARGAENPFFGASYADLESIDAACRTALTSEGFAVVQPIETSETGQLWLYTILMHSSGQHLLSKVQVRVPPASRGRRKDGSEEDAPIQQLGAQEEAVQARKPQVMGSAITYYRRYALGALVGVVAECEDDDGEQTEGRDGGGRKRQERPACPTCKTNESVIPGKAEFGGGWVCWKKHQKRPGCGASWTDDVASDPKHGEPQTAAAPPETVEAPAWQAVIDGAREIGLSPGSAKIVLAGMGFPSSRNVQADQVERVLAAFREEHKRLQEHESASSDDAMAQRDSDGVA